MLDATADENTTPPAVCNADGGAIGNTAIRCQFAAGHSTRHYWRRGGWQAIWGDGTEPYNPFQSY